MYNTLLVYYELLLHLKQTRPDVYTKTHRSRESKKRSVYRMNEVNRPERVTDWESFKAISDLFFWNGSEAVIAGYRMRMGKLGYIHPKHVEADPEKPVINWQASLQYQRANGLPCNRSNMVFYTVDTYCRVAWMKGKGGRGIGSYEFNPSAACRYGVGFRDRFTAALSEDELLSSRYNFYTKEEESQ